jgi:hypothetical protein
MNNRRWREFNEKQLEIVKKFFKGYDEKVHPRVEAEVKRASN